MFKRMMAATWRLRLRRLGWALSLTIGLDPRRFAWTHHCHQNVGFGPAGAWGFGWGMLTYIDCRGAASPWRKRALLRRRKEAA